MTLTADRNTPRLEGDIRRGNAAAVQIYAGALLMRNAGGFITGGATATGSVGVGRAEQQVNNVGGSAGGKTIDYRPGVFRFNNSASADAITIAEIGDVCWIVNDQTVAKTTASGTRSPAGVIDGVDAQGVWVRFDEALTRVYVEGIANPV